MLFRNQGNYLNRLHQIWICFQLDLVSFSHTPPWFKYEKHVGLLSSAWVVINKAQQGLQLTIVFIINFKFLSIIVLISGWIVWSRPVKCPSQFPGPIWSLYLFDKWYKIHEYSFFWHIRSTPPENIRIKLEFGVITYLYRCRSHCWLILSMCTFYTHCNAATSAVVDFIKSTTADVDAATLDRYSLFF